MFDLISTGIAVIVSAMLVLGGGYFQDGEDGNTAEETAAVPEAEIDTVIPGTEAGMVVTDEFYLPKNTAEGKEFNMFLSFDGTSYIAEDEKGDEISDAVFSRNQKASAHTGAQINFHLMSEYSSTDRINLVRNMVMAGDNTFDAFLLPAEPRVATLAEQGFFVDWHELPYVNLDSPWWNGKAIDAFNYGEEIYAVTGDYDLDRYRFPSCILFNKDIMDELGLEYPYELVREGKWTADAFISYIKASAMDINGDNALKYEVDRYGFGGWQYSSIPAACFGFDGSSEGVSEDAAGKMRDIFATDAAFAHDTDPTAHSKMFDEGRLLFADARLDTVIKNRSSKTDFGVLPYPKLTENQREYHARINTTPVMMTYIPVTNSKLELTGAVFEALAYYSFKDVVPTYVDLMLKIKSARDIDSEEMIDIIISCADYSKAECTDSVYLAAK